MVNFKNLDAAIDVKYDLYSDGWFWERINILIDFKVHNV